MMVLLTLWRIVQAGFHNFMRNAWLSTAATAVMTITLSVILSSFIANLTITSAIEKIINKIDVSVYLEDSITKEQKDALQKALENAENVESVRYVSKDEALERYKTLIKDNKKLLEGVNEAREALPASFEVKAKDPNKLDPISRVVEDPKYKDHISEFSYEGDRKATIDKIVKASNFIRTTGLVASLLFVVISVLIIFNTIRMAIFTRREEIEIMKLVGATSWFIRGPFLFEAALYGIIGAFLAIIMTYLILSVGAPRLTAYLGDVSETLGIFSRSPFLISGIELLIGIVIGGVSSLLAMVRYLKL